MDSDSGRFVDEAKAEPWMQLYRIGETVKVKGEEFEVLEIHERRLVLKPLSAQDRHEKRLQRFSDLVPPAVDPRLNRAQRRADEKKQQRAAKRKREV